MSLYVHLLLLGLDFAHGIKVLKSNIALEDDGKYLSGARLIEDRMVPGVEDITLCIRFNLPRFGGYEGRSRLITIEDWRPTSAVKPNV